MEQPTTGQRYAAGQFNRETRQYDVVTDETASMAIRHLHRRLAPADSGAIICGKHPIDQDIFPASTESHGLVNVLPDDNMYDILGEASPRVIAVDLDGTMVDTVPYKIAQNLALAHEFGNPLTVEDVRKEWNDAAGFNDLMHRLTESDDMAAIMSVVKRDYDKPEYAKRRFEFAEDVIRRVRTLGHRTALITNLTSDILRVDAHNLDLDLDKYFEHIQTIDNWPHKKPDPRVFEPVLEQFDAAPHEILYIGDELKDAVAARDAGVHFIGVETGMTSRQEFDAAGFVSIKSLAQLLPADK